MQYRYLSLLLSLLLFCSVQMSCTRQTAGTQVEPDIVAIQKRGRLLVGTTADYRPLSFRDEKTGRYQGYDIEMAERIGLSLGVPVEYVRTSWPTLTEDVLRKESFDLAIGGISITPERTTEMSMSDGYLASGKTILCRKQDASRYQTLADLNRKNVRIMVNPGGTNERFARETLLDATILVHQRNEEIPSLIAEGKADVMITETTEAPWYVQQDRRLAAPLLNHPFTRGEIGVLIHRDRPGLLARVNEVIRQMKKDGSLRMLNDKYGFASMQ